mmetsp:Transcript_142235/g.247994  ORF Transcript_142235/g.247994 Transcript_142235/m.247994 type:complete len:408 (-) Transcript_142235:126-1349(-)
MFQIPEGNSFQLAHVATQNLIPRSHTGSSLSSICKSARGDPESLDLSLSVADIRAAARDSLSSLRAPCNPSTPRGIRGCKRNDLLPGTPLALRATRYEDTAGEDGREIWLERSGVHEAKAQLQSFPLGRIRASPDQRRVDELIAVCSSLVNTNVDFGAQDGWSLGASVAAVQPAKAHRQGPSINCGSVSVPRSLQSLDFQSETPCLTPIARSISRSISRESDFTVEHRPAPGLAEGGSDASPLQQASMNIRQGFLNVLGMVRQATCCSGMPEQCPGKHFVPGQSEPGLSGTAHSAPEQCEAFTALPAACDRDRRRSVGEFVVVGRSDSEPAPATEEEGFIPECWARVEECSKTDGALAHWKDYQCDVNAEALTGNHGDDEVVVSTNQSSSLHVLATGLQKQLRCGGA